MRCWRLSPLTAIFVLSAAGFLQLNFALIKVDGTSMLPNYENGNLVLVWKNAYRNVAPNRGEVVVARVNSELIIKRVLGVPGEVAEVRQGKLFINDSRQKERYFVQNGSVNIGRGELGPGKYGLFGDNRDVPKDQLIAAVVRKEEMLGKVIYRLNLGMIPWNSWFDFLPGLFPAD
jgi:signal peptidase I